MFKTFYNNHLQHLQTFKWNSIIKTIYESQTSPFDWTSIIRKWNSRLEGIKSSKPKNTIHSRPSGKEWMSNIIVHIILPISNMQLHLQIVKYTDCILQLQPLITKTACYLLAFLLFCWHTDIIIAGASLVSSRSYCIEHPRA